MPIHPWYTVCPKSLDPFYAVSYYISYYEMGQDFLDTQDKKIAHNTIRTCGLKQAF